MPKNIKKGKNHKNYVTNSFITKNTYENEEYGEIIKELGNCLFKIKLINSHEVVAKLQGSMIKSVKFDYVKLNSIVIVKKDINTTGKDKYYITHCYSFNEKNKLEQNGELTVLNNNKIKEKSFIFEGQNNINEIKLVINESFINKI